MNATGALHGFKVQTEAGRVRFAADQADSGGVYTQWYNASLVAATSVECFGRNVLLVCYAGRMDETCPSAVFRVEAFSRYETTLEHASKWAVINNYKAENPMREVRVVNGMVHGVLSDYSFFDYADKPISLHSILDDLWDDFSNDDTDTDTDDADENKEV